MKDTLKKIAYVLLWGWQALQNLCALAYMGFKPYKRSDNFVRHYERDGWFYPGAVTLGEYIITNRKATRPTLRHEYGHVLQSRMLGPLYLFVIGLPSIVHAAVHGRICKNKDYYHFFTEKWANKLSERYFSENG